MWVLVCINSMILPLLLVWDDVQQAYVWQQNITVEPNTVVNIISYDGTSPYTPPDNTQLFYTENNYQIGDQYAG
jgi:hypothetical protein